MNNNNKNFVSNKLKTEKPIKREKHHNTESVFIL